MNADEHGLTRIRPVSEGAWPRCVRRDGQTYRENKERGVHTAPCFHGTSVHPSTGRRPVPRPVALSQPPMIFIRVHPCPSVFIRACACIRVSHSPRVSAVPHANTRSLSNPSPSVALCVLCGYIQRAVRERPTLRVNGRRSQKCTNPRRSASRTASVRFVAPSLPRIDAMWNLTV